MHVTALKRMPWTRPCFGQTVECGGQWVRLPWNTGVNNARMPWFYNRLTADTLLEPLQVSLSVESESARISDPRLDLGRMVCPAQVGKKLFKWSAGAFEVAPTRERKSDLAQTVLRCRPGHATALNVHAGDKHGRHR